MYASIVRQFQRRLWLEPEMKLPSGKELLILAPAQSPYTSDVWLVLGSVQPKSELFAHSLPAYNMIKARQ